MISVTTHASNNATTRANVYTNINAHNNTHMSVVALESQWPESFVLIYLALHGDDRTLCGRACGGRRLLVQKARANVWDWRCEYWFR